MLAMSVNTWMLSPMMMMIKLTNASENEPAIFKRPKIFGVLLILPNMSGS